MTNSGAPKMKSSEKIAWVAFALGILACLALKIFTSFSWWASIIIGALIAGGAYNTLLKLSANESIVDSKSINGK